MINDGNMLFNFNYERFSKSVMELDLFAICRASPARTDLRLIKQKIGTSVTAATF